MEMRREIADDSQYGFEFFVSPQSAREYHESKLQCEHVLRLLRKTSVTKVGCENARPGARIAPAIDILRNGYGFEIAGSHKSLIFAAMDAVVSQPEAAASEANQ